MWVAVALALPIVVGALVVQLLRARTSASLLDLFLGAGLGLGATSVVWFLWLVVAGPPALGFHITEAAAVVGLGAAVVLTRRGRAAPPVTAAPVSGRRLRLFLGVVLALVVASSLVAFVVCWLGEPHGHWDAVEIWNMRARFFVRAGDNWRDAFAVTFPGAHTDYPLLLPASVARGWGYVGQETTLVPALIALTFTLSAAGVLWGFVSVLRGPTAGLLAALALLGTSNFLRIGFGQIADVPLGFFVLAAVGLLCLHDRAAGGGRGNLILAGMMAGFAAWVKNEGLLFLVCLFAARLLVHGLRHGWKAAAAELPALLLGVGPVLLVVVYFKATVAGANDLVSGQGGQATLSRLADWPRYRTIAAGFFWELLYIGPGAVVVLALAFALLGSAPPQARRSAVVPLLVTALLLLGYIAVYATTPKDVYWHLRTSLHRLYMHLWPLALLGYFLVVATPEEALARRAALSKKA
jgi:hypothetical protein